VLLYLTLGGWVLLEISLRARELVQGKGRSEHDRGTRVLIGLAIGAAVALAVHSASLAPSLRMRGPYRAAGLTVMWLGLAIRVWAIAALGSAFRTTVEVRPDQAVVSRGPYRWVRHPSYAGLLLIVGGFGLGVGNWLALAGCVLLPLPALWRRIKVEEAELSRVLGESYRTYQRRTKRLVPGLW
jgi:protein-S-isoprenylcysteine O-methyltransferase Ste14